MTPHSVATRRRAPRVFVSYAHEDERHRRTLEAFLVQIERDGLIAGWHDRKILAGQRWEKEIDQQLEQADIVILLVTQRFLASSYINGRELVRALEREAAKEARVIPVLVDESDWINSPFARRKIQAVPRDGKPIVRYRPQSGGWTKVAEEIRRVAEVLADGPNGAAGPVEELIGCSLAGGPFGAVAGRGSVGARSLGAPVPFDRITDFWKADRSTVEAGTVVAIEGTLSEFAPLVLGSPTAKRSAHLEFRRALAAGGLDNQRRRTAVNALLAFSAGQMVWRLDLKGTGWKYLGLYQAIVRNSIAVFVEEEIYRKQVREVFRQGDGRSTVEARVVGRLQELPESFISRYLERHHLGDNIEPRIITRTDRPIYGIVIDGEGGSSVEYVGATRYLDGDIWVAVDLGGEQRVLSRFCDLSDPEDLRAEAAALRADVVALGREARLLFEFDQVDRMKPGYQSISVESFVGEILGRNETGSEG